VNNLLELFVGGCPLCSRARELYILGKCAGCRLVIRDLTRPKEEDLAKAKEYRIRAVPTLVINGRIRVTGVPEGPFLCSPETYRELERLYSFR